ncbi:uncharacterized protein LOC122669964 [Telopea speciosissima]|uniref:uncharacterized protein LOC122669964 n=1 Tax=Telopea speciosissima TaxID=54955 RepID=UPI001CC565AE|nr:uncharacterized protein LOC122669964 [Telopea speciosissima]
MYSQQQNLSELQHSSEQQMGSKYDTSVSSTKPFSIRQYVFEARQKDIYNNWPFPEEYLKVCSKHGVSRVLPPFGSNESIRNSLHTKDVGQNCAKKEDSDVGFIDKHSTWIDGTEDNLEVAGDVYMDAAISEVSKKVNHLSLNCNKPEHGDGKGLSSNVGKHPLVSKDNTSNAKPSLNHSYVQIVVALPSTKAFRKQKQKGKPKKHKGKPKKRLLADILAEARPCTLEDIDGLKGSNWAKDPSITPYGFAYSSINTENFEDEGKESMTSIQPDCRPILKGGIQKAKHPRDDNAGNGNLFIKRKRVVKFNLNGNKSKLCNRVIIPPGTVEREWESIRSENFIDEGKKKNKVEYDSEPKLDEELSPIYDSAGGRNLSAKKKPKMKVNFRGFKAKSQDTCISKAQNRKMLTPGTVERRDAVEQNRMPKRRATSFQEVV